MKKSLFAALAFTAVAAPAFAHHPLAGQSMETFTHGLLSGIGHPLLGFDHLFFVLAVGIAALCTGWAILSGRALSMPLALALFAGFGLFHGSALGDSIAARETVIGGSVLIGYLIGLAGAVVAGIGVFLTLETFEGFAFAALGIGA